MLSCCSVLEHKLSGGECTFHLNDQAALLQLLSQAEKDHCMINDDVCEMDKDRLSVLEIRLKEGPLASSHMAVLQLLGQAEVDLLSSDFKFHARASACQK